MARPIKGGVGLARHFNLKHAGGVSITPQAAHKWLSGQAIPKADKIRTLAHWLGVSEHWLHYGPAPEDASFNGQSSQSSSKYPSFTQALSLAQRIEALPERQRHLVEELIEQFYGKSPK
jgi:transcriptional regulator with XRE-family HTH domain